MDNFKQYLAKNSLKSTIERESIYKAAVSFDIPFSIDMLFERVLAKGLRISRSTVYRNIPLLIKSGVIMTDTKDLLSNRTFRRCEEKIPEKAISCRSCGSSVVIMDGLSNELSDLLSKMKLDYGDGLEKLVNTLLSSKGHCTNCFNGAKVTKKSAPGQSRVLLFEDDSLLRILLKDQLEGEGHEVYEYPAFNCFNYDCVCHKDHNCICADVIIIDIKMPDLSGIDFIKKLRAKNCRIGNLAFMTGNPSEKDLEFINSINAKFFYKPYDMPKIKDWVRECCSRNHGRRVLVNNFLDS